MPRHLDPAILPLAEALDQRAVEGLLYTKLAGNRNDPLITAEWAVEVFAKANAGGIVCGFVSNGNATPEALEFIRPDVSLYKVDLKGFKDARYRELGGKLQSVVDTIKRLHSMGVWIEIVALVISGHPVACHRVSR